MSAGDRNQSQSGQAEEMYHCISLSRSKATITLPGNVYRVPLHCISELSYFHLFAPSAGKASGWRWGGGDSGRVKSCQFGSPKIQKWHCRGARKLAGFDCMYAQCLKPSVLAGGGSQISLPSRLPTQWGGTVPPRRAMLPPPPTLGRWAGEPEQVKAKPHQSIDFLSVCSAACVFAVFSMTGHNLSQIGNRS